MKKNLYIALEPLAANIATGQEVFRLLLQEKIQGVNIYGIQAICEDSFELISDPNDFRIIEGFRDSMVAPMLALKLVKESYLKKVKDRWTWASTMDMVNYHITDATEFGIAMGGCGRMGAMMNYPHVRCMDAANKADNIARVRTNFNINVLNTVTSVKFNPDIDAIVSGAKVMVSTPFEPTPARIKDINSSSGGPLVLMARGLSHLKQVTH
jgi:hypothetical protein